MVSTSLGGPKYQLYFQMQWGFEAPVSSGSGLLASVLHWGLGWFAGRASFRGMNYWLIKSEPDVFGIEEMKAAGTEPWDGIRNYQARNFMRDEMEIGDLALFYHSNTNPPGVAGVVKVASKCYPDPTQFDKKSKYYDEKSKEDKPRWLLVDFEFVCEMPKYVSLEELKEKAEGQLEGMLTLRKGNRLSVMPVEKKHFTAVCKMGGVKKVSDLGK